MMILIRLIVAFGIIAGVTYCQQLPGILSNFASIVSSSSPSVIGNLNNFNSAADTGQKNLAPVVQTAEGAIIGRFEDNGKNKPFFAYFGIPYAQPPIGQLRFKSPEPPLPWQGIKMATDYRDNCLGYYLRFMTGEEDCLFLNVAVPKRKSGGATIPVVFWIHGGGFIHGSEATPILYHPGAFTDKEVIFVSVNYRLGPLGFLSTDDSVLPGNYGMKDLVMALKWVQRNIARFGGDPNQVHLFGQSAGAVCAHALSISPLAKGLFKSVVALSGSLFTVWGVQARGKPTADRLARALQCPIKPTQMANCLRTRGAKEITLAIQEFFFLGIRYGIPFSVGIDSAASDPFMPEHPLIIVTQRKFKPVPFILGTTIQETKMYMTAYLYNQNLQNEFVNDWDNQCGKLVHGHNYFPEFLPNEIQTNALCKEARSLYFTNGKILGDGTGDELVKFSSDSFITFGVYTTALLHSKYGGSPVYVYNLDHENEGAFKIIDGMNYAWDMRFHSLISNATKISPFRLKSGKSHSDDLFVIFDPVNMKQKMSRNDLAVQNLFLSMFQSLWYTGHPRAGNIEWPTFNEGSQKSLTISANPKIESYGSFTKNRLNLMAAWYDLYQEKSHQAIPSLSGLLGLRESGSGFNNNNNVISSSAIRILPQTILPAIGRFNRQVNLRTLRRAFHRQQITFG